MDPNQNTPENINTPPVATDPEISGDVPAPPLAPESNDDKAPFGPVVGIVIVVVILAIGGFYIWGGGFSTPDVVEVPTASEIAAEEDLVLEALVNQNDSDEVGAIEEDLDTTELDALDADLANIDAELGL